MNALQKQVNNLEQQVKLLQKEAKDFKKMILILQNDAKNNMIFQKDFGKRQIISREIQFMSKVYDQNGNVVTEINP